MAGTDARRAVWIDTHAHLDHPKFAPDLAEVLQRAAAVGVGSIVSVGADLPSSRAAVRLAEQVSWIYAAVGVHPHEARSLDDSTLDDLRTLATHPKVVAVGEIGLDFYHDIAPRPAQRQALARQLELALAVGKPIIVHIRDKQGCSEAYDQALAVLQQWVDERARAAEQRLDGPEARLHGVLHCFSGDAHAAQTALAMGFCLGVDGPLTFPSARELRAVFAEVPLDRVVLETDCPYLAPQAYRGRRNEPAYVPMVGAQLADTLQVTVAEAARMTSQTARRLFGLQVVSVDEEHGASV